MLVPGYFLNKQQFIIKFFIFQDCPIYEEIESNRNEAKQISMIERNTAHEEFSTVKIENVLEEYTRKTICRIIILSFFLVVVIIFVIFFVGLLNRHDSYDVLLSLGFIQLIPEESYNPDDSTRRNWYHISNVSLTMKEARKYCFDLFPGTVRELSRN